MQTSVAMRSLIESFEGCRLEPYADAVGVPTVGFGHTGDDVSLAMDPISQEQADQLLAADLEKFEGYVTDLCPVCSQQQFDALVSFTYNLGQGALEGSSLRRLHNEGDYTAAAQEFGKWNHAGGQVLAGLTRRRAAEAEAYATGTYGEGTRLLPEERMKDYKLPPQFLTRSPGHYRDWIRACKGGPPAMSNFDYAGPLTEMALLGNVAMRVGQRITWDAEHLRATDCPAADQYIRREYRKGWTL